jgi:CHAT domain-containing protein/tetratricopeptide (TPR) repeat protein
VTARLGAAIVAAGVVTVAGCRDTSVPSWSRLTRSRAQQTVAAGDVLLARAESLYLRSEYDSVVALMRPALDESRRQSDSASETRVLTRLGLTSYRQGDLATSRSYLESAIGIGTVLRLDRDLLEAHNALALVAQDEDRYDDAAAQLTEAMRLARSLNDRRGFAKASGNLGLTLAYMGELRRARELLTAMRDSGRALGETRYEANAMANLAMVDIWEGNASVAVPALDSARALYRTLDYPAGEQNALGQLATAYIELGDYAQAFAALDSALVLARAKGMKEDEAEVLALIASLHARLGDYRAAMRAYDETAVAAQRLGLSGELGTVRRSTAGIHLELGDLGRARADAQAALRIHEQVDALFEQLDDLLVLAEIAQRGGQPSEVGRLLASAGRVADSLGAHSAHVAVAVTAARLADRAHDSPRVLASLRAVDSMAAPGDFAALAEVRALAARAFARAGRLDSAVAVGAQAIAAVERVRGSLASEPLRRALLADRSTVYADQVIALLRLHREKEAFSVADAARSRGLVDYIASARADLHSRPGMPGIDEGEQLLRQIDVLLAKLKSIDSVPARERGPGAGTTSVELMSRLERARADYESYLVRAGREQPRAAALLGVGRTSLDRVQLALSPDEALLEYLVASDRVVVFVATRTALQTFTLAGTSTALADRVRLLRELWGTRDSDWHVGLPAARALHGALLGPIVRAPILQNVRRLVIVPHGVLSQLPFGALVDGRTERFVAQDFELVTLPSAGTLAALRGTGAAAVDALGGIAFAPFPRELPASATEVAAVRRAMPRMSTAVGGSATEQAVRAALGERGIVHVATHGLLDSRNPMFTRIELAGTPAGNPADDGRLEVHELLGVSIRSRLVFLSGCETSVTEAWLDDAVRGTDYTTLAQSLLYAGAENVIGTLWRVDDAGAAAFAERFYTPLARLGIAGSLASATRDMLGTSRFAHPYYWAGYVLTGVGRLGG